MKILATIIAHPLRKISGATNAGYELSLSTASLVDIQLAMMWDRDETIQAGPLTVRRFKSTLPLGWLGNRLPRSVRVPLYDSHIPELVDSDYDLVHIHNLIPTFAAERLAMTCRRRGIPYVISTHGFYEIQRYAELNSFGRIKTALVDYAMTRPFRRIIAGAAAIFALSDCEISSLTALGVPEDRIYVVTNGVKEFFLEQPRQDELSAVRTKFNLQNIRTLLFMGSLHAYKGVDVFLRSLALTRGEFQAVVAGSFKNETEKQALLQRSGLSPELLRRLVFTGGVTDVELRALYHRADVLVYPTLGDTLPLVVLEAMACGRPVVATHVGGIPFAVRADTGILVDPGDAVAVSRAVNTLLNSEMMRWRMGKQARVRVEEVFRWPKAAARAVEIYKLLQGRQTAVAGMHASA